MPNDIKTTRHIFAWQPTVAGVCCAIGFLYLAHLSNLALRSNFTLSVFNLLATHFYIAAVVLIFWCNCARRNWQITYRTVIMWAVIFRVIGVYGSPILEDDYFRYLLDGCAFVATGTPFGVSPDSMFGANSLPAECQRLLSQVNNPHLPTIYAPVLQYVFAALHLVAPVNIKILQLVLSLFDLGLVVLLCRYAPARHVMLYAWCPLVVKEISFNAHPDIIGIVLLMAAFHSRKLKQPAVAVILAAMACATKAFAVLLLPFLLWRLPLRYFGFCAGVIILLYLPFILRGETDISVLQIFLRQWQFNPALFLLASHYFGDSPARVICFSLFALWWCFYFISWARARTSIASTAHALGVRGEWVFGVFLLLSPVVNPWYVLWLLPFAVVRPRVWAWSLAVVVPLSYFIGLHHVDSNLAAYQIAPWAYYTQIMVLSIALAIDRWRYTRRRM